MSGEVLCRREGAVAQVLLRHPQRMNAMSRAMWAQLREIFLDLQQDRRVRVVIVQGEAGHFCAGWDIAEYADFRFEEPSLRAFHEDEVWGALAAMLACDLPVVAQIEGNGVLLRPALGQRAGPLWCPDCQAGFSDGAA
jgi:enoyl-CoA hydratase/carnithine racemase